MKIRRVVTGHKPDGKSTVVSDTLVESRHHSPFTEHGVFHSLGRR